MTYKGVSSPFEGEEMDTIQRPTDGVERQLERLAKERMVLTEAWEQLNSRLQIALGPQRPQKGDTMAEPTAERSELSSRLYDESWQLTRIAFSIRETLERLEL